MLNELTFIQSSRHIRGRRQIPPGSKIQQSPSTKRLPVTKVVSEMYGVTFSHGRSLWLSVLWKGHVGIRGHCILTLSRFTVTSLMHELWSNVKRHISTRSCFKASGLIHGSCWNVGRSLLDMVCVHDPSSLYLISIKWRSRTFPTGYLVWKRWLLKILTWVSLRLFPHFATSRAQGSLPFNFNLVYRLRQLLHQGY